VTVAVMMKSKFHVQKTNVTLERLLHYQMN